MSINFEAANMAGYNNPEMYIFPVTVTAGGAGIEVVGAPSYSTLTNIIKSGYIPVLFASLPTGDRAVLPLTAITNEEQYIFSIATATSTTPNSEQLISIIFGAAFEHPIFLTSEI